MSVWDSIVGQQQVVEQLKAIASGDPKAIAQSWLICGPPGSGRSNVARAFAAALESPDHGLGDEPTKAAQQVLAGTHPDVTVLEGNVDSFNDPGKGKEFALSMYNQGADFIQAIAGASGMGIYNASVEANRYSFGVGANINYLEPDHIVATAARKVNEMVYNEVKALVDGTWTAGYKISGIAEGAVGYDASESNVVLPENIQKALTEIEKMIVDGTLVPPESMDEIDAWAAANQYGK